MTSPSNSPTSATGTGDNRTRARRGGRGRGGRPAGDQPTQHSPARTQAPRDAVPAPVVVPVGADATVLPTDTTFDALGVPAPLVEVLTASGITAPFPIQVATLPDSLAGPRRARPRPHRLRQDARLQPPAGRPPRRLRPASASPSGRAR